MGGGTESEEAASGGTLIDTVAIVEFDDGTVDLVPPRHVRFAG